MTPRKRFLFPIEQLSHDICSDFKLLEVYVALMVAVWWITLGQCLRSANPPATQNRSRNNSRERQYMRVIEWCLISFQDSTLQVFHIYKLGWDRLVIQDLRQMRPESAAERYTNTQLQDPQMRWNLHSFWNTSRRIRIDASQQELFELVSNFSNSPLQHRIRPIMMPTTNFVDIRAYTSI